jgi:hypothetical protein
MGGHKVMDARKQSDYLAYLLRFWRVREDLETAWRASLENAKTHEVHGFRDLEALMAFLRVVLREGDSEE